MGQLRKVEGWRRSSHNHILLKYNKVKLEVKEKALSNAEGDVGSMSRRVLLLEEEVERSEERLAKTVTELSKYGIHVEC